MLAALTGAGLSAAAGLNAYIPFVLVALIARYTDFIDLPSQFAWIESGWAIGIATVLLISEAVLDKIAIVDHINDTIGTAIRPATGALVFAAVAAAEDLEKNSSFFLENPWIGAILGAITAGIVHTGKAATRPVVNATTAGVGAPVVSTVEDGTALTLSLVAIFLPVLVIVFLIAMVWAGFAIWKKIKDRRERRAQREFIDSGPGHDGHTLHY